MQQRAASTAERQNMVFAARNKLCMGILLDQNERAFPIRATGCMRCRRASDRICLHRQYASGLSLDLQRSGGWDIRHCVIPKTGVFPPGEESPGLESCSWEIPPSA